MVSCQRQDPGPHPCPCHPVTNARGCIHAFLCVCTSPAPCCGCLFPGDKFALPEWLCVMSCWDNGLLELFSIAPE